MRAFALFLLSASSFAHINLEQEYLSDFVLNTKQIIVPEFPHAYNPSILDWGEGFLLSFRTGDRAHPKNQIALIFLDPDFNPIGRAQIVPIDYSSPLVAERQQDPRLVRVGTDIFIVYSNMINGWKQPEIRRPFIAKLHYENNIFHCPSPKPIVRYQGEDPKRWSKNWVPFDFNGSLYLSHRINPHIVFAFDNTIACDTVSHSKVHIDWVFGELRGGTPAVKDDDGQYLAFFHSSVELKTLHSNGLSMRHYFMGAYTYESQPPFTLTGISEAPIVGHGFYENNEPGTSKPIRVVFPGGIVLRDRTVLVAYGRQDREIWIATIDKAKLRQSLRPVFAAEKVDTTTSSKSKTEFDV